MNTVKTDLTNLKSFPIVATGTDAGLANTAAAPAAGSS